MRCRRFPIRALDNHGVKGVGNCYYSRFERDIISTKLLRIFATVDPFMARFHNEGDVAEFGMLLEHLVARLRVPAHRFPFGVGERTGLVEALLSCSCIRASRSPPKHARSEREHGRKRPRSRRSHRRSDQTSDEKDRASRHARPGVPRAQPRALAGGWARGDARRVRSAR